MTDEILKIGNNPVDAFSLIYIGKGSFVLARTALNYPMCMFTFWPTAIHLMHHSIEVCIKAFLLNEKINYSFGADGHKLIKLLKLGCQKSLKLSFFNDKILSRDDFKGLLMELDKSYNENRYSFAGYSIKSESLRDLFDELIYIFIENFCKLLGREDRATEQLRQIDVPESLLPKMEYRQKQQFIFCVIQNE